MGVFRNENAAAHPFRDTQQQGKCSKAQAPRVGRSCALSWISQTRRTGPAELLAVVDLVCWNGAGLEEIREIGCVRGVTDQWREVEYLLHGLQVGGVRQVDGAGVRNAVIVLPRVLRYDDLGNGVAEII